MTGSQIALAALQGVGALSLLPYPAILIANVMGMAAEGPRGAQRLVAAAPYALLSLYPLVWIALYAWSWRTLSQGQILRAFALSSVPAVFILAGAGWYLLDTKADEKREQARMVALRQQIEA